VKSTAIAIEHLRTLNPVPTEIENDPPLTDSVLLERILDDRRAAQAPRIRAADRSRKIPLGVLGIVALAVLAFLLLLVPGPAPNPARSTAWHLVSFNSAPFRNLGSGQGQPGLQCVSDTVCFTPPGPYFRPGQKYPIYRTTDGGRHWKALTVFNPVNGDLLHNEFHCADARTCFLVGSSGILLSADGGSTWRSIPTPVSTQHVGGVWCASAERCLIRETTNGIASGFSVTSDGGTHWNNQPAPSVTGQPWALTCDASGKCFEVLSTANTLRAVTSATWGAPWQVQSPVSIKRAAIFHSTCSATYCMFVLVGTSYQIVATSDAGLSWRISGPPKGWLNMPTAVGCANTNDCWIAMSLYDGSNPDGAYSHPIIESTRNFGKTWRPLNLPNTTPAIADVLALACPPSGDGCLAVGNGRDHFVLPKNHHLPLSGPILLSSLP
jgi:photosystem II stability/assembly factor-like uncharacterized protein